jgi:hypothetical protein
MSLNPIPALHPAHKRHFVATRMAISPDTAMMSDLAVIRWVACGMRGMWNFQAASEAVQGRHISLAFW